MYNEIPSERPSQEETRIVRVSSDVDQQFSAAQSTSHERHDQPKHRLHNTLVSPSLCLPPEILSEIFIHCLPETYDVDPPRPSVKRAPLSLCRVTRTWREVALSTPQLWTAIKLNASYRDRSVEGLRRLTEMAEMWIKRSGSCPLSLCFLGELQERDTTAFEEALEAVVADVISRSQRWKRIIAALPCYHLKNIASFLIHDQLEFLYITLSTRGRHNEHSFIFDLSGLHRLTFFTIHGDADIGLVFGETPYQRLTTVQLRTTEMSMDDCLTCLRRCPSIVTFDVTLGSRASMQPGQDVLIVPHLSELCFIGARDVDFGPLLDHLRLPVLRKMMLQMPEHGHHTHWPHLTTLVHHSNSPFLSSIALDGIPMSQDDTISFLQEAHYLQVLRLDKVPLSDPFLHALTRVDGASCLCPQLQHIFIDFLGLFTEKAIENLILSRWDSAQSEPRVMSVASESGKQLLGLMLMGYIGLDYRNPAIRRCVEQGFRFNG